MDEDLLIRPETDKDLPEIYELIKTAFATARVADGDEQDFAVRLRRGPGYIPELALVVEHKGRLIGHIMLTRFQVNTPAGRLEALLLAPVSVLLEHRNQKVGSRLILEALKRATAMGHKAVFLVGDPAYYSRFGFEASARFGIKNADGIEDKYVMSKELVPGVLKNASGTIIAIH